MAHLEGLRTILIIKMLVYLSYVELELNWTSWRTHQTTATEQTNHWRVFEEDTHRQSLQVCSDHTQIFNISAVWRHPTHVYQIQIYLLIFIPKFCDFYIVPSIALTKRQLKSLESVDKKKKKKKQIFFYSAKMH